MPLTTTDVPYLRKVEQALNGMLRSVATANGAMYVDTYTSSLPFNACTAPGVRYVEPLIPAEVLAEDPEFGRKMVVLGRALTDGFYIAACAGDDVDFAEFADLSATAVEALIARRAEQLSKERNS